MNILSVAIYLALFLVYESGAEPHLTRFDQNQKSQIRFNSNGNLKIVNIADLHYGEAPDTDWGPEADLKSTNVTRNILTWEQPDFVIFTGDQLTAEHMYPNASLYVDMLVQPLVDMDIPWASTYGNHDLGPNVTREGILESEQKYNLSYTFQMNETLPGVTNYYLPIYNFSGDDPVMIWWFLDSRGGQDSSGQQPHWIDAQVVQWFRDENAKIRETWGLLPSLVFFHIPTVEYEPLQEDIVDNPLCAGQVDDDVTPQEEDTGVMQALVDVGGVQAMFVGHDHGNSWCCLYKGIQVCYNRHTGYGGYGTWTRGARVVELKSNSLNETKSYVRLEDGDITDHYPPESFQKLDAEEDN